MYCCYHSMVNKYYQRHKKCQRTRTIFDWRKHRKNTSINHGRQARRADVWAARINRDNLIAHYLNTSCFPVPDTNPLPETEPARLIVDNRATSGLLQSDVRSHCWSCQQGLSAGEALWISSYRYNTESAHRRNNAVIPGPRTCSSSSWPVRQSAPVIKPDRYGGVWQ